LGYYNGSEVTRQEKDVPPTVQNTTSSVSAETLYSLLSRLANNRRHCDEGPSYRSRSIPITWGMRSDLSKRVQFNNVASSSFSTDPPSRIVITRWMSSSSTTTILSEKASGSRTRENCSSKSSIDAAHPFAADSPTESGSLGCYDGSEATNLENDVLPTVKNTMSTALAETPYSSLSCWANNPRQYADGLSYISRGI